MSDLSPRRRTPEEIIAAVREGQLDQAQVKVKERATLVMRDMETGRVERKVMIDGEVIEQAVLEAGTVKDDQGGL